MNQRGIYIAAGSNIGDRTAHILDGLRDLQHTGEIVVVQHSTLHETHPQGGPINQPMFLNAAAELETPLPPRELLNRLQAVERLHGRERNIRNGPRTLDLDLLLYGEAIIREPGLCVPHPRMWQRSFVMQPLREICPQSVLTKMQTAAAACPANAISAPEHRCTSI